jgi:metal-responsive CopG/Arc/MetJ family transcriptional regulator
MYLGTLTAVAKITVSLTDDLLAEVDAEERRGGTTRGAAMREFDDAALRRRRENRVAAMRLLLGDASPHGELPATR